MTLAILHFDRMLVFFNHAKYKPEINCKTQILEEHYRDELQVFIIVCVRVSHDVPEKMRWEESHYDPEYHQADMHGYGAIILFQSFRRLICHLNLDDQEVVDGYDEEDYDDRAVYQHWDREPPDEVNVIDPVQDLQMLVMRVDILIMIKPVVYASCWQGNDVEDKNYQGLWRNKEVFHESSAR